LIKRNEPKKNQEEKKLSTTALDFLKIIDAVALLGSFAAIFDILPQDSYTKPILAYPRPRFLPAFAPFLFNII
jgi:hypothetical protein